MWYSQCVLLATLAYMYLVVSLPFHFYFLLFFFARPIAVSCVNPVIGSHKSTKKPPYSSPSPHFLLNLFGTFMCLYVYLNLCRAYYSTSGMMS